MKKVLLVEDNKNISRVIQIMLKTNGYDYKIASDGITATEIAFDWKPDIILLDIKIPKMNGLLVCETLKKDEETSDIPILMLSAIAEEETMKKADDLGASDYIIKPVEPKKLLEKIKENLEDKKKNGDE
ncbi:MAG: response regulator [Fusobacteriota bacterium]